MITRKRFRFPCHIFDMADAAEAQRAFQGELVRDYGDKVTLSDGKTLHWNYMWDEGFRHLMRCRECGGLVIIQYSEFHSFTDSPDGYYEDWIPAASEEEADLMNILLDAMEMERYSRRHLRGNNCRFSWTDDPEPIIQPLRRLKRKILNKYPDADPNLLQELFPPEKEVREVDPVLLDTAIHFAYKKRAEQIKKGIEDPYITRSLSGTEIAFRMKEDPEMRAAVLNNLPEWTSATKGEIVEEIAERILSFLDAESRYIQRTMPKAGD